METEELRRLLWKMISEYCRHYRMTRRAALLTIPCKNNCVDCRRESSPHARAIMQHLPVPVPSCESARLRYVDVTAQLELLAAPPCQFCHHGDRKG